MKTKSKVGRPQKGLYKLGLQSPILNRAFQYRGKYMVYGLASLDAPQTVQYIGYTSMKPNVRYSNHIADASCIRTAKALWIQELLDEGKRPIMILIEDGIRYRDHACEREKHFIQIFKDQGMALKNLTLGGDGICGYNHTEETRMRQSEAMRLWRGNLKTKIVLITQDLRKAS